MVRPHTAGRRPHPGESSAYALRIRHSLTHLYAMSSQQLGSWAGGLGGTSGGLVTSPAVTSPPPTGRASGPAPCGDWPASGPAVPRPRTGPTHEEERRRGRPGPGKGGDERKRMREKKRQLESRRRPGWGRSAAGGASAGLKVEGSNEVQRVESLA